eukprot:14369490-Alexandrium_andersonii.AAC.1
MGTATLTGQTIAGIRDSAASALRLLQQDVDVVRSLLQRRTRELATSEDPDLRGRYFDLPGVHPHLRDLVVSALDHSWYTHDGSEVSAVYQQ